MNQILDKKQVLKKTKDKVICARLSSLEYQAMKKRANDAGVSLSKFVHSVLLTEKLFSESVNPMRMYFVNFREKQTI